MRARKTRATGLCTYTEDPAPSLIHPAAWARTCHLNSSRESRSPFCLAGSITSSQPLSCDLAPGRRWSCCPLVLVDQSAQGPSAPTPYLRDIPGLPLADRLAVELRPSLARPCPRTLPSTPSRPWSTTGSWQARTSCSPRRPASRKWLIIDSVPAERDFQNAAIVVPTSPPTRSGGNSVARPEESSGVFRGRGGCRAPTAQARRGGPGAGG